MIKKFEKLYEVEGKNSRNLLLVFKEEGVEGLHFHIKNEIFDFMKNEKPIDKLPKLKCFKIFEFTDRKASENFYFLISLSKKSILMFRQTEVG